MYPKVLTEYETLEKLQNGASIARYGDGELKLCRGASIKCQVYSQELSRRLREILVSDTECLIGIPRIENREFMTEQKSEFWGRFAGPPMTRFYDLEKVYASAFITRPDSVPELYTAKYFMHIKRLWLDRGVVLINGDNRRLDKDASIFQTAYCWQRWGYTGQNAWSQYPDILSRCLKMDRETVFVIALGPTATVLAYDLALAGYQALDMGHIGMFYARFQRNEPLDFDKRKEAV